MSVLGTSRTSGARGPFPRRLGRTYGVTLNRNVAGQWHGYAKRSMMPDASVGGLPTRIKCLDALRWKLGEEEPCLGDQ